MTWKSVGSSLVKKGGFIFYGSTDSGAPGEVDDDCYLIYHKRDATGKVTHSAVISMQGSEEFEVELYNSKITFSDGDEFALLGVCSFPTKWTENQIWNAFEDQIEALEFLILTLE